MPKAAPQRTSWLCRNPRERERVVDMERRLKPVRGVAFGLLTAALVFGGPWVGWWPLGLVAVALAAFVAVDRNLDRFARPELWIASAWILTQVLLAVAVALTGGPRSPAVAWLAVPVVTLSARFDRRGVSAGVAFTAALMTAATVARDPALLAEAPQYAIFPLAMLGAVAHLSTALMASDIEHRTESGVDELTGMLNRRALRPRLDELAGQAALTGQPVGVVMADMDGFKAINDRYGHAVGDRVLVESAHAMRRELRAFDLAYRVGGEEFLVVLPGATLAESAALAERLRAALEEAPRAGLRVTMSLGVASSEGGRFDHAAVIADADAALYRAKADGRNRVALAAAHAPAAV